MGEHENEDTEELQDAGAPGLAAAARTWALAGTLAQTYDALAWRRQTGQKPKKRENLRDLAFAKARVPPARHQ